jgi:GT2 family glycosyltransferase
LSDVLLSLVVCTLGRTDQLRRLLASLDAQTDRRFRTIIVDQNPPGFLGDVLREAANPVLLLRANPGLSRARNLGITHASAPLIGFPDDDCWYSPTTVAEVIDRFDRAPAMQVLTGRTVDADGHESVSQHLPESRRINRSSVFLAGNSNTIFARRGAILDAGGFDESLGVGAGTMFGSGEETDFLLRCLRRGFEIRYERDFLVHHDQVTVSGADLARIRRYSAGFGRVARLHRLGAAFVGARVARAAARSCLFLITGNVGEARSRWSWIRGCLAGFAASS